MELKYTEKLARIVIIAIYGAIAFFILKYFGAVIGYIVLSLIVALIAKPLVKLLRKIKIFGRHIPYAVLSIFSIILILGLLFGLVAGFAPVFVTMVKNISISSAHARIEGFSGILGNLNSTLRGLLSFAPDFNLEAAAMERVSAILNFDLFGSLIGTVAYTVAGIFIGLFAVVFIAFFMIKDEQLFPRLVAAVTPDRHLNKLESTIPEVERLLSRYFVGLIIEIICVGAIDFIGLWAVAKIDFELALGIGFMAGVLNLIPYLGPLFGGVLGTFMAVVLRLCKTGFVIDVHLGIFILVCAAIFSAAQLVDNMLLQPLIYSTSVQAHPLEIFIVLLLAGSVGGIVGMLLAIPAYTVVRVFCINFFPDSKIVKSLLHK